MILVVQSRGCYVGKRGSRLYIKQDSGEREILLDQIQELHLYPSCSISTDALEICMEQDIWVVFLDKYGELKGELVPFSGGCAPIYKRNQLRLTELPLGVQLVKEFQIRKIDSRISYLKEIKHNKRQQITRMMIDCYVDQMDEAREQILAMPETTMNELRAQMLGLEGSAGRAYFTCIGELLPKQIRFQGRAREASDIFNCCLNYLYGIMYGKIKHQMYLCRLDPYIGIMHVDSYNKPTFVYDFIEGYRVLCERIAYRLCSSGEIQPDDMELTEGKWLFSDRARKLLISEFNRMMGSDCVYKHKHTTWTRRIHQELLAVAQRIGEVDKEEQNLIE